MSTGNFGFNAWSYPQDLATVTSVGLALPAQFTITVSPITTSGTLTATLPAAMILADGSQAFTADQSMGSHKLTNVTDPAAAQDAATKNYVDLAVSAIAPKNDCQTATTTGLAAYTYNNGSAGVGATITLTVAAMLVLDGYTPVLNDRILVKNETGGNAPYNGIYYLSTVGVLGVTQAVLTRSLDFDQPGDGINGALVYVLNGTVNGNTLWSCTTGATIVFGTTNINWTKFLGSTYTADETTLHLAGTTFSVINTYAGQSSIVTLGTVTTGTWNATPVTPVYGGTGLATLTAHAVMLGEGTSNVAFATSGTAGRLLIDQGAGANPAFTVLSGSGATITLSAAGVLTISAIANASLVNSSITIGGTSTALGGSVLANVTNDTQTKASIVPNTAPSAGQILAGNAGGTTYAPVTVSGSGATVTLSAAGVFTVSAIANASLSNSSVTISGHSLSLGGTLNLVAADIGSGAALTKTNDTNVTLTLGGTPTAALLAATSITVGWTGTLAPARGGTGVDSSASTGIAHVAAGTWTFSAIDLSGADATGTLAAGRFPALTGDVTTVAGNLATTLATVNATPGTFSWLTVNAKGLVTAASNPLPTAAPPVDDPVRLDRPTSLANQLLNMGYNPMAGILAARNFL